MTTRALALKVSMGRTVRSLLCIVLMGLASMEERVLRTSLVATAADVFLVSRGPTVRGRKIAAALIHVLTVLCAQMTETALCAVAGQVSPV